MLGTYTTERPGPTVVAIGGMHGNEPAGARAVQAVMEGLRARQAPLRGRFIGLRGNRGALRAGRRYLERDLNRGWSPGDVARLLADVAPRTAEDHEQIELLELFVPLLRDARQPVVFLDLHSTSGPGAPFICMADVLRNRRIAFALPIPLILGIEEILDGALLGYVCDLGHVAVGVEGGQHDDPRTQRHLEAAVWLALVAAGALRAHDVPDLDAHRTRLSEGARGLPAVVEIRHRHAVADGDGFEMLPGFDSFAPLRKGQEVARDRRGAIRAPERGVMLMPRYQSQGDDGYFVARAVSRLWLRLSAVLRHARADRLVPLLPGVRRDPARHDHFIVDARVARFQVRNVFHLLGYRHERRAETGLVFSRRRPGRHGLQELPVELRALGEREAEPALR